MATEALGVEPAIRGEVEHEGQHQQHGAVVEGHDLR
jgi:hypothetical protein